MTPREALRAVCDALQEAVDSSPQGVPGGHLYAAMMSVLSLEQFEQVMAALVQLGRVRRQGQLYLPRKKS